MSAALDFLACADPAGQHRLAYWRWQEAAGPAHLLVHGLTRNGRDFDRLAERLAERGPVYAPDMPGRGESEWLGTAAAYNYPQYTADVGALIRHIGASHLDYVGTSMGGIIGMLLAAEPNSPIRRLVLNDIGPFIPKAALRRIGTYVGSDTEFPTLEALAARLRQIMASFGPIGEADWAHLLKHGHRRTADGRYAMNYDPKIGDVFKGEIADVDLWEVYDRIRCPVLVVRGRFSDILSSATVDEMSRRGPCARSFEVRDAGHAPALVQPDQLAAIQAFFDEER